jgi:mannitol/fructose-specific phosphotransferase system IIA component (Ntr-type)
MIKELLKPETLFFHTVVSGKEKKDAVRTVSKLCAQYGNLSEELLYRSFMDREQIESTGFGGEVAIPHAKLENLAHPFIAIVRFEVPVEWESMDDLPVKAAIALVMPAANKGDTTHLEVLAQFSRKLVNQAFLDKLVNEQDPSELYRYIIGEMGE